MTITYPLLVNALIAGLLMGGFYAALSVGATVAFGLLDIVNIAHPTFAVIGAYAVLVLNRTFNIDPIICGLLLTPAFYGAGMLLYQLYHHFFERHGDDAMRGLAFFFGLMFIAEVALIMLFGVDFPYVHAPYITTTRASARGGLAGPHQAHRVRYCLRQRSAGWRLHYCDRAAAAGRRPRVYRPRFRNLRFRRPRQLPGTIVAAASLGLVENLSTIFIGASWSPAVAFGVLLATPMAALRPVRTELTRHDQLALSRRGGRRCGYRLRRRRLAEHRLSVLRRLRRSAIRRAGERLEYPGRLFSPSAPTPRSRSKPHGSCRCPRRFRLPPLSPAWSVSAWAI